MKTTLITLAERVIERLALFGQDATLVPPSDPGALQLRFEIAGVPVLYRIWPAEARAELRAAGEVPDALRAGLARRLRAIAERMWQVPSTRRALAAAGREAQP